MEFIIQLVAYSMIVVATVGGLHYLFSSQEPDNQYINK